MYEAGVESLPVPGGSGLGAAASSSGVDQAEADRVVARVLEAGPGPESAQALAGIDPCHLSEAGRLDLLRAWQAQASWAEARGAAVLVAVVGRTRVEPAVGNDDAVVAQRSRACEAALTLRMSEQALRARYEVARDLATRLPATRSALERGQVSWAHARSVSEVTAVLDDDAAREVDTVVASRAPDQTPSRLRQRCRAAADRIAPDAAERRLRSAHRGRRVERFGTPEGEACLAVWSDPRDILAVWKALTQLAGPADAADPRPLGARRVDALLGLCLGAASEGEAAQSGPDAGSAPDGGPRTPPPARPPVEVQVVVELATLLGLADDPAELRGHGPIPAGILREWLTDATAWRRLVTDPVTGYLLDYGPRVRFAPPKLKRFLAARDGTCVFPECHQPGERTDADHHPPWQPDGSGGSTSAADMACLCRQHHRWRTHHGWTLEHLPDRYRWTSPPGRQHDVPRHRVLSHAD